MGTDEDRGDNQGLLEPIELNDLPTYRRVVFPQYRGLYPIIKLFSLLLFWGKSLCVQPDIVRF